MTEKKPRKPANKQESTNSVGNVNINIQGNVIGSNLIAGNNNQASLNSSFIPSQHPLPTYKSTDEIPPAGDLPPGSRLPFAPNPLFTGREADLKKLAETLCPPLLPLGEGLGVRALGSVITQAVTGMGGLGKTQLAVEFAYRCGKFFRGVHWLNLADPTLFDSEIATCGKDMAFPNFPEDQPSQVTLTLQAWKTNGPRLVILDNFEDPTLVNDILPRLRHSNIRILVTSRRSDWLSTTGLNPIPLNLFSPAESLEFLKRSLLKRKDKDSDHDLNTLAERLGHLPLALELAGRYLNAHPRLSVTEYLEQAKEALEHPSMKAWQKDMLGLTPTQHDTSLLSTFALSWSALRPERSAAQSKGSETAQLLFQTAGYLAPNTPIPPEIFEKALEISTDQCDEALTLLYALGLLQQSESPLTDYESRITHPTSPKNITHPTIHPLLAEYARGLSRENLKILEALAKMLATLSKEAIDTGLPARFDSIKPHIPVFALYAENEKIESVGALLNNYGYHLWMIADYSGARAAYERALKIDEASFGLDHPNVAIDVNNLGGVLQDQGDLVGARAAFERALKIDETAFGPDHPNVAIRVNNLGGVMRALGDLDGARAAFERALTILKKFLPPEHPNIKLVQGNLDSLEK